jgi:hypothetical protein
MNATQSHERRLLRPAALMAALSALGLTFTLMVGPALAVTYATVTDHVPFSSEANNPDFWESEGVTCDDIGVGSGDTYVLGDLPEGEAYVQVIVKSGSGEFANTVFGAPPSAGETVWADTNGNSTFDDGDQGISHIIVCTGEAEEESEEPSVEESTEASVEESTEASVEESTEASVEESTEASVEGSVLGGTGTPAPSTPDTALDATNGPSPLPTIVFGAILLASLAGLAWVNVQAVRTRS